MEQQIYIEFEKINQNKLNFLVEIRKEKIILYFSIVTKTDENSFTKFKSLKESIKNYSVQSEYDYIINKAKSIAKKYGYKLIVNSNITVYGV